MSSCQDRARTRRELDAQRAFLHPAALPVVRIKGVSRMTGELTATLASSHEHRRAPGSHLTRWICLTTWPGIHRPPARLLHQPRHQVATPSRASLGTIWGPHGMHATEQHAGDRPPCPAGCTPLSWEYAYSPVLGVKGSPVQIRPSRLVVAVFRIYFYPTRASTRAIPS